MRRTHVAGHRSVIGGIALIALGWLQCSEGRRSSVSEGPSPSLIARPPLIANTAPDATTDLGDFAPQRGGFGPGAADPYDRRLREVLFAEDERRICELVAIPSFDVESAVYVIEPEQGLPLVVSRRLDQQLWGLMMFQLEQQAGGGAVGKAISFEPVSQSKALAKIHASATAARAEIDRASVEVLAHACGTVLRRTHHRADLGGHDGVTYHAAHWERGTTVAGRAHSPASGTISSDYVALGAALSAYATSALSRRPAVKAELVAQAERLITRASVKPKTGP